MILAFSQEKSLSNATKAIRLAKSSEDKHGEAISYIRIGSYYDVKSHYDTALQLFNKAQELGSKKSDYLVLAQTYIFKGVVNRHMSNYQIALVYHQFLCETTLHRNYRLYNPRKTDHSNHHQY